MHNSLINRPSVKTICLAITKLILVIFAFTYLLQTGKISFSKLRIAFEHPLQFSFAVFLFIAGAAVAVERWRCLLRAQGAEIPYAPAIKLTFVGYFFSTFLPGGVTGDLIKGYYFSKGSNNKTELFLSLAAERVLGMYTIILFSALPVMALYVYTFLHQTNAMKSNIQLDAIMLFVMLLFSLLSFFLIFPFLSKKYLTATTTVLTDRFPNSHIIHQFTSVFRSYAGKPGVVIAAFMYSCLSQLLLCIGMYQLAMIIGVNFTMLEYAFILPICFFINNVAITPAGIGVGELGFAAIFSLFGSNEGANVAVLFHVVSLFVAGGIGGLVYFMSDMGKLRRANQPDP